MIIAHKRPIVVRDRLGDLAFIDAITTKEKINPIKNSIYFFMDEAGHEQFAPTHHLFAIGGCAIESNKYGDNFREVWCKIRQTIFKVPNLKPVHASAHLKKLGPKHIKSFLGYLEPFDIKYFGTLSMSDMMRPKEYNAINVSFSNIESIVNRIVVQDFDREEWFFEKSNRSNRQVGIDAKQPRYYKARSSGGISLVEKSMLEPGIEISDIISHVIYQYAISRKKSSKFHYNDLLSGFFGDHSKGILTETISVSGRMRIKMGEK